jgi:hypothetical protein
MPTLMLAATVSVPVMEVAGKATDSEKFGLMKGENPSRFSTP